MTDPSLRGPSDPLPVDHKLLDRVRGLLAKAESTTFPAEAEALTAKAQELMARHSIDVAMVDARGHHDEAPGSRTLGIDQPYATPKFTLLARLAAANRCEAVWAKGSGTAVVFGFAVDLDNVEVLFTSLLVQATAAMVAAGPQVDASGRSRTRSFRTSFLTAYALRIGERLAEAAAASVAEAESVHGAALVPVLEHRVEAVHQALTTAYPRTATLRSSVSNGDGWFAGRRAADRAHLPGHEPALRHPG